MGLSTRLVCLEQLMNPGRTLYAGATRDLPDRQPRLLCRNDGSAPFPLGVRQPCHGKAEAGEQLLFATDTLLQGFRGVYVCKGICFSLSCTET